MPSEYTSAAGVALPPAEASFLVGDANPVITTIQSRRERLDGQIRPVVFLAQMCGDQMLQALRVDLPQQCRRLIVFQMAETPGDPLLQGRRIARRRQQRLVVVALQHQRIAGTQHFNDMGRDATTVGEHAKTVPAVAEGVLYRFAGIVRHGERLDFESTDRERRVTVDQTAFRQAFLAPRRHGVRTMRQIHRQLVTSGKSEDAANVISVFVRHHDGVQVGRRSTQPSADSDSAIVRSASRSIEA